MENTRRTVKKTNRATPLVLVLLVALVIISIAGMILFATGYRYISTSGVKYSGFVKDGQPVNGTVKYADGISGKLTKEADSPVGAIVYSNGNIYEGELKGILRHGKGTITYKNTGEVYTGDFVEDQFSGYAVCTSPDGASYEGEVLDGKKNGLGKYTYPDGAVYYGEFKDDKRNGNGVQYYADGSVYYGSFADDKRSGSTEVTFTLENGMVYKGECKMQFANGDVYVGDFLNDRRTGNGKYTWATGEVYTGEFSADLMNGTGTYDFGNGREPYTGKFVNGQLAESEQTDTAA